MILNKTMIFDKDPVHAWAKVLTWVEEAQGEEWIVQTVAADPNAPVYTYNTTMVKL